VGLQTNGSKNSQLWDKRTFSSWPSFW